MMTVRRLAVALYKLIEISQVSVRKGEMEAEKKGGALNEWNSVKKWSDEG